MSEQAEDSAYLRIVKPNTLLRPHAYDLSEGSPTRQKIDRLEKAFRTFGFDMSKPALVGYPYEGKIQLLDGGHRTQAAHLAGRDLPVWVKSRVSMKAAYGTHGWEEFTHNNVPAQDLLRDQFFQDNAHVGYAHSSTPLWVHCGKVTARKMFQFFVDTVAKNFT